jgi:hypothetical protein
MSKPLTASRIICSARESDGAWVGVVYGDGLPIWTSPYTGSEQRAHELANQHRNALLGLDGGVPAQARTASTVYPTRAGAFPPATFFDGADAAAYSSAMAGRKIEGGICTCPAYGFDRHQRDVRPQAAA